MQETIIQILSQHEKICKHFLSLQKDMKDISEMVALLGYSIEEITEYLQKTNQNNTLRETDDVN